MPRRRSHRKPLSVEAMHHGQTEVVPPTLHRVLLRDLDSEGRGVGAVIKNINKDKEDDPPSQPTRDKVVFVKGALPNETVEVVLHQKKENYDTGVLHRIIRPSSQRTLPDCIHESICGGCSLQHLEPASQVAFKQRWLEEGLMRIGKVQSETVLSPIYGQSWHYRRRARLSVRWVEKKGRVLVGFHEKSGRFVADIQSCKTLVKPVSDWLMPLSALIGALSIKKRIAQVEFSVGDRWDETTQRIHVGADISLLIRHLDPLTDEDRQKIHSFAKDYPCAIYLQPNGRDINLCYPKAHTPSYFVSSPTSITPLRFDFTPNGFIQVNAQANQALINRVIGLLGGRPYLQDKRVVDLFCGLGNFSLPLAACGAQVIGIEGADDLVLQAKHNAHINHLSATTDFFTDNLFTPSPKTQAALAQAKAVLIDPPRDGAMAIAQFIPDGVKKIVYVSCHPATLARDAGILVHEKGFRLMAAGIVNMFPHTNHVEAVALFER